MTENRFQELFEAYIDGSIGETESRELLDAFEVDPDLKTQFFEEMRFSNTLCGLFLADEENSISSYVIESLRLGRDARGVSGAVVAQLKSDKITAFRLPIAKIAIGIAAAIAVAFLVHFNVGRHGNVSSSLASVAHLGDAKWANGADFTAGEYLGKERLRLSSGIVRLDFANGVRVTLEGPADFELIGPTETRLHSGTMFAHVPPEGIGFEVHTERGNVVDLGTTFGITVSENGSTDVSVYEGEVKVTPAQSIEEKLITEGNFVTLTEDSDTFPTKALVSRSFRGWPVLFGVLDTGGNIRFVNAQRVRSPSDVTDLDNIVVFPEQLTARPSPDLKVTITEPGKYSVSDFEAKGKSMPGNDGRVTSYLVQYNPPYDADEEEGQQINFTGQISFDRPILAVIANRDQLTLSDKTLGNDRYEYFSKPGRGLEHDDFLTLSDDRRTLQVDWHVLQKLKRGKDQIRVIVGASSEDSK